MLSKTKSTASFYETAICITNACSVLLVYLFLRKYNKDLLRDREYTFKGRAGRLR